MAALSQASSTDSVNVMQTVPGQRSGGFREVQIMTILSQGSTNTSDLGGWFRLSFNGSQTQTQYLSVSSSASIVTRALGQLNTLRAVTVSMSRVYYTAGSTSYAGYSWNVTFSGDVGNQPALVLEGSRLFTSRTSVLAWVSDGDNSLNAANYKNTTAMPGEAPQGYNAMTVASNVYSYTIGNLVPGNTYYVSVSSINAYGAGPALNSTPGFSAPPKQVPQAPTNVTIGVHAGSSTSLDVTFTPPSSDGGSDVLFYRVELDPSIQFPEPFYTNIYCPTASLHSVFQITTIGGLSDPIIGGHFNLTLSANGYTYNTDVIPYDATALMADELGWNFTLPGIICFLTSGTNVILTSKDSSTLVFINDRFQFDHQRFPGQIFTVKAVNVTHVTLDSMILMTKAFPAGSRSFMYKFYGGRGLDATSRLSCTSDPNQCSLSRRAISGSMQSKMQMLTEALTLGVDVDRSIPDAVNGLTWRVTFLDPSPSGPLNFNLQLNGNDVRTASGASANITVTQLVSGINYPICTGTKQVPQGRTLANGQYYYGRVFASNEIGYSLPQVTPTKQKPMVPPGPPTSVSLAVSSATALQVVFNPPASDGGDSITAYNVTYSTSSTFNNASYVLVTYLSGGAPFQSTITGLRTGTFYFVSVSAVNSQGAGPATRVSILALFCYIFISFHFSF